jgi:hypothetical protein
MVRKAALLLFAVLGLMIAVAVVAAGKSISVYVDGRLLKSSALEQDGIAYLPVRAVAEALGCAVRWDSTTRAVYIEASAVRSMGKRIAGEAGVSERINALIEQLGQWRGGVVLYTARGPVIGVDESTQKVIDELVGIGEPALSPVIAALRSENRTTRYNAVSVLGKMKSLGAVEALISALEDESPYVQTNAALALETLTGEKFGKEAPKWREWWERRKNKPTD